MTAFVTPETNLRALAQENFGTVSEHKVCLTGLHVCGNLASTCIKLFCKNEDVLSVCSIGCCYNLLTEKFEMGLNSDDAHCDFGFPMSNFLKKLKYCLGRNARMIACQPIDRICLERRVSAQGIVTSPHVTTPWFCKETKLNDSAKFSVNSILGIALQVMKPSLFWRAAIQIYFERVFGPKCDISVGRRCSKATNFTDYCLKVQQSLERKLEVIFGGETHII